MDTEKGITMTDLEKAHQLIEQEKERVTNECKAEVEAVLKKYNCKIDVIFSYHPSNGLSKAISITVN